MKYHIVREVEGKLVSADIDRDDLPAWLKEYGFEIVGTYSNLETGVELHGHPVISGLHGPMCGGPDVIWYEDHAAYGRMSR